MHPINNLVGILKYIDTLVEKEEIDICNGLVEKQSVTMDCRCLYAMALSCKIRASKGLFLLVQNDGEEPLKVNVVISDINITFPEIQVSRQQSRKIKILAYVEGSPSIILNAGYGKCIIPIGSEGRYSQFYKQYVIYLSPIHGVYLLFFTILIAGGAWACCKIGKNEQHTDGIRYQELEMEQPPSHSTNDEEMAGGWNQDWDDEWGEEHEVKPPNGHQTENVSGNGHNSKTSDTNGWGNDWDD
ncbi:conserved hypothetical protein [Ricinus communis]|uniref:DUF7356 domain-containing protein n=2 Tax=Ricinus communis TaxID=3988 RepID=B9S4G1_RICCO|nr:conserved hypothetical protein [Ricinus communis]